MKTPEQIFEQVTENVYTDEDGRDPALVVAAIEADRAQRRLPYDTADVNDIHTYQFDVEDSEMTEPNPYRGRVMTVQDLIDALGKYKRDLPVYVFDGDSGDVVPAEFLSLFDGDQPHGPDNPLSITINP